MDKDVQFKWDTSKNMSNVSSSETESKMDESSKDQFKPSIKEHYVLPQSVSSSNSTTAVINPLKNTSGSDAPLSIINIPSHSNEQPKTFSRRNTVQPLLKKPISNAPTTSIKPLILPAPTSDSFSQHTKSNIISMHNSHHTNSISTPFNCQQPMTMGIATIQPQHFGYQNLSNNRYPMIPMSIPNNYSTQQLTLTNGGLGTTVQLMPVMSQTNNQMNNSRVQSVPLFMAPIIGSHGGMLFQPNMTLMPQNSTPMQTFNIANTSYSHDFSHCQTVMSQTLNPTIQRQSFIPSTEFESYPKSESVPLIVSSNSTATVIPVKENSVLDLQISAAVPIIDQSPSVRPNVKQRGLIRTQIYRMKQLADEDLGKERHDDSPMHVDSSSTHDEHEEVTSLSLDDDKVERKLNEEIVRVADIAVIETPVIEESNLPPVVTEVVPATMPSPIPDTSPVTCQRITINQYNHKDKSPPSIDSRPTQVTLSSKRRLPSPEILDGAQPTKQVCLSHDQEPPVSGRKSPGSLFEKISQVIPERKSEILQNNKVNKLTAVVRPEQRKMLVHYLDDLVIFESDEPFPTTNKMQVVKSALRAGNIKLTPQKSKLLNDQYLFLSGDEDLSPSKHKSKPTTNKLSPSLKSSSLKNLRDLPRSPHNSASFMEPLTIDIPTTTSSSCDSLDSSQVRPLSVCSYQSTLPASLLSKKTSMDNISPEKEMPKIDKERSISSVKSELCGEKEVVVRPADVPVCVASVCVSNGGGGGGDRKPVAAPPAPAPAKDPPPVKLISPVKQGKPAVSGLDRPVSDWSVLDVVDFVKQTPGCENYCALFQNHEIDGEALLLLSKDNLIQGALNMKIGPALKLCARIEKRKALDPPPPPPTT